jgi:hypothetical protein
MEALSDEAIPIPRKREVIAIKQTHNTSFFLQDFQRRKKPNRAIITIINPAIYHRDESISTLA